MFRKHLVAASAVALMATGALAQTGTPSTTQPAAPAQTAPMQSAPATPSTRAQSMANDQLTSSKIVGISIYAPKPDQPGATGSTASGAMRGTTSGSAATMPNAGTTGGMMGVTPVSDEQWRTMRDGHDSIGKVDDLVIGTDGRVTHAVLGVGGFLGIGEKNVALPLADVKFMRMSDGTLVGFVTSTKQQLQDMPTFQRSRT